LLNVDRTFRWTAARLRGTIVLSGPVGERTPRSPATLLSLGSIPGPGLQIALMGMLAVFISGRRLLASIVADIAGRQRLALI
jgi:hypothetical protein